ncbi:Glutamate racemase [Flexistipes sinusarabici DSM 4947]|uniref:Glutamate racemase n=1 Tax=Flexistipes sinusarabici (strain ATCC 49648 / DSM 4947 / MAS 10) TaxID=717231 RepID=F8E670_FLESM|nr:glutamate racemase [Flexistipes sinusarabici]AEI14778.1 Glutamate racemase [Flexistipes sinusarabici DSM 4947]
MTIGIFDSGVGGLTVFKSIAENFPEMDLFYLGDTARVPYGNKSPSTVKRYSEECASFLIANFNVDALVIACNTASSYAIDFLREKFGIPVVGVVAPGSYQAVKTSINKKIGIIGTNGTVKSRSYYNAIKRINGDIDVYQKACPLFVPLVEEGRIHHEITDMVIKEYVGILHSKGIDTLILGCTHYPLLKKRIKSLFPSLNIVDSAEAILKDIENLNIPFKENGKREIFVTDDACSFEKFAQQILGETKISEVNIEK